MLVCLCRDRRHAGGEGGHAGSFGKRCAWSENRGPECLCAQASTTCVEAIPRVCVVDGAFCSVVSDPSKGKGWRGRDWSNPKENGLCSCLSERGALHLRSRGAESEERESEVVLCSRLGVSAKEDGPTLTFGEGVAASNDSSLLSRLGR